LRKIVDWLESELAMFLVVCIWTIVFVLLSENSTGKHSSGYIVASLSKRRLKFFMTRRVRLLLIDEATWMLNFEDWFYLLLLICNFCNVIKFNIAAFKSRFEYCCVSFLNLKNAWQNLKVSNWNISNTTLKFSK